MVSRFLLCSQLDEFTEQLGSFDNIRTKAELGGNPELQLIETTQETLHIGCGCTGKFLWPNHVVNQLHLKKKKTTTVREFLPSSSPKTQGLASVSLSNENANGLRSLLALTLDTKQ